MEKQNQTNEGAFVLDPVIQRYTIAKPFQGNDAKEVYKAVKGRVAKDFADASAFAQYFKFDEETEEIRGSNLFFGVLTDEELASQGLWLPTIVEAKKIDAEGRLTNRFYRDYGAGIYSPENPNAPIAKSLIKEANRRAWKAPILAPFKALKLGKGRNEYGAIVGFRENVQDVMYGEEAKDYLLKSRINQVGNSGARRLVRYNDGVWDANWYYLAYSYADGRVDWVCGEATTQNLENAVSGELNRVTQMEIQKINDKLLRAKEAGFRVLRS